MRFLLALNIILLINAAILSGQTKAELEEQRKKTLEEISYVDGMLQTTEKQKIEGMNALRMLGNKLYLRESVIRSMGEEINLLSDRIEINRIALDMMEDDLTVLKNDYQRAIINSYKSKKINPEIVYLLSAKDFNQGYKRLKYLQQVTKYRRNESEIIAELKEQIEGTKERLETDLTRISELQKTEVQQKDLLKNEQTRRQRIVRSLGSKQKQLQKELSEKKRIAKRIEEEIARVVEAERKRALKSEMTPEQKLIGENFSDNKGRLPWPVEKGIITAHFGVYNHPVLKYVKEENVGIEITSVGKINARSVFKGEVSAISAITGANMTVIIRHGNYLTVYSNLVNVKVKTGDRVDVKQVVGEVYSDPRVDNSSVLKFMVFEQKNALDPEIWITKL
jgi:septal ring factor EnvC (AmiA/AmiB activator)